MGQHNKIYLRQKENNRAFVSKAEEHAAPSPPAPESREESHAEAGPWIASRLDRLERQHRRTRVVVVALLLLGAYLVFVELAPRQLVVEKTHVESKELKLTDAAGTTRMFLRMYSDAPVLQLMDSHGQARLSLGMRFDDTPFIALSDGNGQTRATLEMTEGDEPALRLYDANGDPSFHAN